MDTHGPDTEFAAMQVVYNALDPLEDDARARVINYIIARLEISTVGTVGVPTTEPALGGENDSAIPQGGVKANLSFKSFAELHDAAQPKSNSERALVAAYWLQVCVGAETFDGLSANKELKNLGHGLPNITTAINSLKNQKPALVLQLKKSGSSQQSRKTYKVTVGGIKAVEDMIHG